MFKPSRHSYANPAGIPVLSQLPKTPQRAGSVGGGRTVMVRPPGSRSTSSQAADFEESGSMLPTILGVLGGLALLGGGFVVYRKIRG